MFPSKNMTDYMTEINRLFARTSENEPHSPNQQAGYMGQSPFHPTMANQSSSSTDSTSPESFPDISGRLFRPNTPLPRFQAATETPFPLRRQRPIVGRKLMATEHTAFETRPPFEPYQVSPIKVVDHTSESRSLWPQESLLNPQTPTKPSRMACEQNNYNTNVFYELFPAENKGFEFRTPDKNMSSPRTSRFGSNNISPSSGISMSPVSPQPQRFMSPPPQYRRNFLPAPPRLNENVDGGKVCSFCRKNGETPLVYMTHSVKERIGNKNVVTCPILRSHVCSTCRATGDDAHTITYCPVLRSNNNGMPLQSTTITLKNTRVKSNGRKRY